MTYLLRVHCFSNQIAKGQTVFLFRLSAFLVQFQERGQRKVRIACVPYMSPPDSKWQVLHRISALWKMRYNICQEKEPSLDSTVRSRIDLNI